MGFEEDMAKAMSVMRDNLSDTTSSAAAGEDMDDEEWENFLDAQEKWQWANKKSNKHDPDSIPDQPDPEHEDDQEQFGQAFFVPQVPIPDEPQPDTEEEPEEDEDDDGWDYSGGIVKQIVKRCREGIPMKKPNPRLLNHLMGTYGMLRNEVFADSPESDGDYCARAEFSIAVGYVLGNIPFGAPWSPVNEGLDLDIFSEVIRSCNRGDWSHGVCEVFAMLCHVLWYFGDFVVLAYEMGTENPKVPKGLRYTDAKYYVTMPMFQSLAAAAFEIIIPAICMYGSVEILIHRTIQSKLKVVRDAHIDRIRSSLMRSWYSRTSGDTEAQATYEDMMRYDADDDEATGLPELDMKLTLEEAQQQARELAAEAAKLVTDDAFMTELMADPEARKTMPIYATCGELAPVWEAAKMPLDVDSLPPEYQKVWKLYTHRQLNRMEDKNSEDDPGGGLLQANLLADEIRTNALIQKQLDIIATRRKRDQDRYNRRIKRNLPSSSEDKAAAAAKQDDKMEGVVSKEDAELLKLESRARRESREARRAKVYDPRVCSADEAAQMRSDYRARLKLAEERMKRSKQPQRIGLAPTMKQAALDIHEDTLRQDLMMSYNRRKEQLIHSNNMSVVEYETTPTKKKAAQEEYEKHTKDVTDTLIKSNNSGENNNNNVFGPRGLKHRGELDPYELHSVSMLENNNKSKKTKKQISQDAEQRTQAILDQLFFSGWSKTAEGKERRRRMELILDQELPNGTRCRDEICFNTGQHDRADGYDWLLRTIPGTHVSPYIWATRLHQQMDHEAVGLLNDGITSFLVRHRLVEQTKLTDHIDYSIYECDYLCLLILFRLRKAKKLFMHSFTHLASGEVNLDTRGSSYKNVIVANGQNLFIDASGTSYVHPDLCSLLVQYFGIE